MIVKQYGLQRTGTNATKALIETNLRGAHVLSGDKHHDVDRASIKDSDRFVVNVKDPASWVVSYHRYRSMKARNETPPYVLDPIEGLVDGWLARWAARTSSYLRLADELPERVAVVQHEALLRDPQGTLDAVRRHLDIARKSGEPELFLDSYARRGDASVHGADLINKKRPFNRDFHLSGRWAREAPDEVLARCRRFMDGFFDAMPDWRAHFDLSHLAGTAAHEESA